MEKKLCNSKPTPRDLLSSLSNELLHAILSRLPARDAAATCILSYRWLDVWATIPDLNIDERVFFQEFPDARTSEDLHNAFIKFVDRALISRKRNAALRSLRLSTPFYTEDAGSSWVRYAIEHGVQVLKLDVVDEYFSLPIRGPTFTQHSLQKLKIDSDPEDSFKWPESIRLPSLTHLHLCISWLSPRVVKDVIPKSCPRLQNLKLFNPCHELKIIELVNYPLLEKVKLDYVSGLEVLVVQCANLRSLAVIDCFVRCDRRFMYLDAPKLTEFKLDAAPLFSCLFVKSSIFPCLEYASFNMQRMNNFTTAEELLEIENSVESMGSLLMGLANVKQLIINSPWNLVVLSFYLQKNMSKYVKNFVLVNIQHINITYSPRAVLDALYFLIMSSPNLKTLTIINYDAYDNPKIKLEKISKVAIGELRRTQSSSLENLTEVNFKNFGGTKCEIDLLKLFLSSAKALDKVIIRFPSHIPDKERECYSEQIHRLHINLAYKCHVFIY